MGLCWVLYSIWYFMFVKGDDDDDNDNDDKTAVSKSR